LEIKRKRLLLTPEVWPRQGTDLTYTTGLQF